ncbi:MAG: YybS family protein, partial [Syntrophales bacterium]|nr:YybS family protein [Syntrophales bacterium]
MNDRTGLRSHLDLGIGIAVSTLFFVGVALIPAGGTGVIVFLPLPTLLFYAKLGRWRGVVVCFVSLAATTFILLASSRPLNLIPVLLSASLTGLVLG